MRLVKGGWRKLHNEGFQGLATCTIRLILSEEPKLGEAGQSKLYTWGKWEIHTRFCWKTCRRDSLGDTGIDGTISIKWITKIYSLRYGPNYLVQDTGQWQALVNLRVSYNERNMTKWLSASQNDSPTCNMYRHDFTTNSNKTRVGRFSIQVLCYLPISLVFMHICRKNKIIIEN